MINKVPLFDTFRRAWRSQIKQDFQSDFDRFKAECELELCNLKSFVLIVMAQEPVRQHWKDYDSDWKSSLSSFDIGKMWKRGSFFITHMFCKATHVSSFITYMFYKATHVFCFVTYMSFFITHMFCKATHVSSFITYMFYKATHVSCFINIPSSPCSAGHVEAR